MSAPDDGTGFFRRSGTSIAALPLPTVADMTITGAVVVMFIALLPVLAPAAITAVVRALAAARGNTGGRC